MLYKLPKGCISRDCVSTYHPQCSFQVYSSLTAAPFPPLILPVLLAAMRPILRPAEVPRLTVDALPEDKKQDI